MGDSTVETVSIDDETVTAELTIHVTPDCPIKDEIDAYNVTVRWVTDGETFEKWSLKEFLEGYNGMSISQETLCESIYCCLPDAAVSDLCVTVEDVKHMDMVVTKP